MSFSSVGHSCKMADQESTKPLKNNVEETSESETKTDFSSQDETTESSTLSPGKEKSVKTPKGKKKEEKNEETNDDEESSDDEELVGSLDAPLVVQGKRARKSTEFLSNSITVHSAEKKRVEIPKGKGEALGSMDRVNQQLMKISGDELKPLHRLLFGRPGHATEVKKNIRLFKGFEIEKGSKEYLKKEEQVDKFTQNSIKRLCEILDIEKKGTKEEVLERIMDFLLCPKPSGKPVRPPTKKKPGNKSKTKKRKTVETKEKNKAKKPKSDETVDSDEESEVEDEEEPPAKKAKSPKKETKKKETRKETKKTAKKEKKVVSIKISPGKKTKKPQEKKKVESDDSDEEPLSKKTKKSPPTNDEIVEIIKDLLDGADLEKITMKSVCKQVYERFPDFDLTDRKEFIKDSVKEIIT